MAELLYSGGCLCSALRYRVAGPVRCLCYCHCNSCRRAAGAPLVAWATFALDGFVVSSGTPRELRSSADVVRTFCPDCGTPLTYRSAARPAEIDVTLATLDGAGQLAPQMHVWVSDKLPWLELCDGLPQFARAPPPA
jgi:hypothetical protein